MKKNITSIPAFRKLFKCASLVLAMLPALLNAQTFPAGFSQVKVATIYYPTSMACAPDGRIFVTEKAGKVKIIKNGAVLGTNFLSLNVDQVNERGLSSICLDPDFANNHYVYVFYTTASAPIHNRLSRFTANGDVAVPGSEVQIMNFEPLSNSIHNGGGMAFGPDGKLYLAIGNDNINSYSQDLSNYKGKVLRINKDGSVPSGNPFTGSASAQRIWAYGLRNPWTIDIQPGTGKIYVNDVGEGAKEEVNDCTSPGKNFGWPGSEGPTSNPSYATPLYWYPHGATGSNDGCAITGGVFFNPTTTNYPATYQGKYFFIDYCNNWINYLTVSGGTATKTNFASNLGNALNYIKVGADGNLYYFSISSNALYKIIYSNNNAPAITTQPVSQSVPQGQTVTFSVTASGATPMTYQWKKNGTAIAGATNASYTITNVQNTHAGQYSATVTNSFGNATSNSATLTVTAFNSKPDGTITAPANGLIYRGGDVINFSGTATDAQDGTLPASAFTWYVQFHHDAHIHPGPSIPPGVKTGSFNIPVTGEVSANVYYRLYLVVTDAGGLKDTSYVTLLPKKSTLTFNTVPSGLQITLDGQPHTTPYSVQAVSGMQRMIAAPTPQSMGSSNYTFTNWSHGGAASQYIMVTDNNVTYTANYSGSSTGGCTATGSITRDYFANVTGSTLADVPFSNAPTSSSAITLFEGPSNVADNYGSRIRGYICPPTSGNYIFWIASDNHSELWLSTSSSPANKVKIASVTGYCASREWTKYPSQKSAAINLVAGNKYYIEAIHREGTQGDNLAVGWTLPSGALERPIPGSRLSPYGPTSGATPSVTITSPTNGTSYGNPSNITINATATISSGSIVKVEFFEGSNKLGEDLSAPYQYTWMNVSTGNYVLKAVATSSSGSTGTSANVNVSVASCPTPLITSTGPMTVCSGTVTLKTGTATGNYYQWKKDGVNISGATASTYTASSSGEYQVKVINGSCISWSAPARVKIEPGLSASITPGGSTTICAGSSVNLYANTCSGYTYQWKKDGTDIPGATGSVYAATTAGSYQVRITQSGANAWSALVNVQVINCNAPEPIIEDSTSTAPEEVRHTETISDTASTTFQMKVYPNPNNGLFTIQLNMSTTQEEKVKIRVVNVLGQEVYNKEFIANSDYVQETVELDNSLVTGVYTLQVMIGNKVENTNIVLSK
jgi:glucose/arabinose dehydrogenase